jgi:hypothetical protein
MATSEGAGMAKDFPANSVGIQVPTGTIATTRTHWQVVLEAPGKPYLYRLHNSRPSGRGGSSNAMVVEVDGAKRPLHLAPGSSADVLGKRIRVKAGTGAGAADTVDGWYVLVS